MGLAVAACRQRKRVRFTTAAAMVGDVNLWLTNGSPIRDSADSRISTPDVDKVKGVSHFPTIN